MTLPQPVEKLWDELERARTELLREAEGLSQRQADWKPSERDWSVGEIVDHLTLAEVNTGKLTTKLLKELPGNAAVFPSELTEFAPVPPGPPGPAEARPWSGLPRQIDRRADRDDEGDAERTRGVDRAGSRAVRSAAAHLQALPAGRDGSRAVVAPAGEPRPHAPAAAREVKTAADSRGVAW
jgi:hypothetical protein